MNRNQHAFLELVRNGLWESDFQHFPSDNIDLFQVYQLAQEQSVIGVVLAGLESFAVKPPKGLLLQWIGEVQMLEQQNKAMNSFIGNLIDRLRKADVYAILVKGQGIAQCYERPLWRACGDVDLLLSDENYKKAIPVLTPLATHVNEEIVYYKHLELIINNWNIELHGSLRCNLWKKLDAGLDEIQKDVFCGGYIRSWMNGGTQVFLPRADEDIVFVFSHILQHFFKEGIGLRQICDWCRLLWKYRESLNLGLLESRLRKMGVMTEWMAFAALAINFLGMPVEAMPFYSPAPKWSRKAKKILGFMLETGNFGHNRDYSYQRKYTYAVYKIISLRNHLKDGVFFFSIFPLDSIKVTWRRMIVGFTVVLQGKKHE